MLRSVQYHSIKYRIIYPPSVSAFAIYTISETAMFHIALAEPLCEWLRWEEKLRLGFCIDQNFFGKSFFCKSCVKARHARSGLCIVTLFGHGNSSHRTHCQWSCVILLINAFNSHRLEPEDTELYRHVAVSNDCTDFFCALPLQDLAVERSRSD
jgi:hypothetical protein